MQLLPMYWYQARQLGLEVELDTIELHELVLGPGINSILQELMLSCRSGSTLNMPAELDCIDVIGLVPTAFPAWAPRL